MSEFISSISKNTIDSLCEELIKNNRINAEDYRRFEVKRGLRNPDGTGVMAGLTRVCSVQMTVKGCLKKADLFIAALI